MLLRKMKGIVITRAIHSLLLVKGALDTVAIANICDCNITITDNEVTHDSLFDLTKVDPDLK